MAESLEVQMRKILDEYDKEVQEVTNSVMESVSNETVQQLKAVSPKGPDGYARGWRRKKEHSRGISTFIVHNPKFAHLTHLLNNGHIIRNKFGTYRRKSGDNHIGNVEKWANQEVASEIERKL